MAENANTTDQRHRRRLLVVSHPSVVAVNQAVYLSMKRLGWDVRIVVPDRWRHDYSEEPFPPEVLDGLTGDVQPMRVILPGRPQRHVYVGRISRVVHAFRPDAVFLEQESFAAAALQWGIVAHRAHVPFGIQSDENLDRPFPFAVRLARRWVLDRAAFVAARSPTAAERVREWGAKGRVDVVPHAVPMWGDVPTRRGPVFTVGFGGRLVPEKGLDDLVAAVQRLPHPVRLLIVGDGPLRSDLEQLHSDGVTVEVRRHMTHAQMPEAYAEMDVLVLPSRSTPSWTEQFGRVLVEALSCRVPVVGSDSGEIPWVINTTGGGCIYPEGDVERLAETLDRLRTCEAERGRLAEHGRKVVMKTFTADGCAHAMTELLDGSCVRRP